MATYTLEERFLDKVSKGAGTNDCWEWCGSKNKAGYGKIKSESQMKYAHRVSYVLYNGLIPDGLYCLHSCDNPECTNPQHLFLGTHQDNMDDMIGKGRGPQ